MKKQRNGSVILYLEGTKEYFSKEIIAAMSPEVKAIYEHDSDRQRKHIERESRCLISGTNGKGKRCMESCKKCPYYSYGQDFPRAED